MVIVSHLIALGPNLTINQQITNISLPYSLLENLPVLSAGRDPGRFNIVAMLGIGVLVAFGLRFMLVKPKDVWREE